MLIELRSLLVFRVNDKNQCPHCLRSSQYFLHGVEQQMLAMPLPSKLRVHRQAPQ